MNLWRISSMPKLRVCAWPKLRVGNPLDKSLDVGALVLFPSGAARDRLGRRQHQLAKCLPAGEILRTGLLLSPHAGSQALNLPDPLLQNEIFAPRAGIHHIPHPARRSKTGQINTRYGLGRDGLVLRHQSGAGYRAQAVARHRMGERDQHDGCPAAGFWSGCAKAALAVEGALGRPDSLHPFETRKKSR